MINRLAIVTAICTVAAVAGVAGAVPASAAKPPVVHYGHGITIKKLDYANNAIRVTINAPKYEPTSMIPRYERRPKTGKLKYVHVRGVEKKGHADFNPFDFQAILNNGRTLDVDWGMVKGELDDRTLYKGEKESGNLAFHVPAGRHIVKIYFGDGFEAGAYWRH